MDNNEFMLREVFLLRKKYFYSALGCFVAFALWTLAVCTIDVQPIGPQGSLVGLADINRAFHTLTGVHWTLYAVTDWLGLVPAAVAVGFAVFGLLQWIQRKNLWKVDRSILILGAFYLAVMAAYLGFEYVVVNFRPVLINGYLEASYPSSTTMLVLCVMPTAAIQLRDRIKNPVVRVLVLAAIAVFSASMVMGRLISGVHWLSDITGGLLLSAGLVLMYAAC